MTNIIQYAIVAAVIFFAFAYVARQTWRSLSGRRPRCGGCSAGHPDASTGAPKVQPFVPIESLEGPEETGG